jgi:DNA-binding NarL/FixJ family response regulator
VGDGIEEKQVIELLSHLIDHSLVLMQERGGKVRYHLLEIIQQFGREHLEVADEGVNLSRRHRDWYLGFVEQTGQEFMGIHQAEWLDRLEAEHDNLRCALRWSLEQKEGEAAARMCVSLWSFWMIRGYVSEGLQWLEQTLAQYHENTTLRAEALRIAGILTGHQGDDSNRAWSLLEESLAVWRTVGDTQGIASTLLGLGMGAQKLGNYERATTYHEESLALLREVGDMPQAAINLSSLGLTLFYLGNFERARARYEESFTLFRARNDRWGMGVVLTNLGMLSLAQGDHEQAKKLCEESLPLRRSVGDKGGCAHTLTILGRVAIAQNNYQQAAAFYNESLQLRQESGEREGFAEALEGCAAICAAQGEARNAALLLGAAETIREPTAIVIPSPDHTFIERIRTTLQTQLSMRDFTSARAEGRSLTVEQALALTESLASSTQSRTAHTVSTPHTVYPNELTSREVEVLRLVARGLTDSMVAERLVISPRTVQGHVRSIFNKIHVNSRSAATRFAIEHKLV